MQRMISKMIATASIAALSLSAAAEELVVGLHMPLTGGLARSGSGFNEGIQTAATIFNKTNSKHKVKLITVDDESAPAKAVAAVEKLSSQNVKAIIGGYGSNIIGPASDAAERLGLTYITAGGVSDTLVERGYKHFFRINNIAGYEKAVITLMEEMGAKSVSVVFNTKEATSGLATGIEETLKAKGIKVALHGFDPAITDFKPVINKVKVVDKPDVIVMSAYENEYVGILRAAKVLKPSVKAMVGVWSLATPQMASDFPDLMPNVLGTALLPFPVEYKSTEGKQFAETYKSLFKKDVDYLAQFGYVEAAALFNAMARAADDGSLAKGRLSEVLRKTNSDTLIGKLVFDAKGDNPNFRHRMGQHQAGKIVVVSPRDDATGPLVFPGLPW